MIFHEMKSNGLMSVWTNWGGKREKGREEPSLGRIQGKQHKRGVNTQGRWLGLIPGRREQVKSIKLPFGLENM